MLRPKPKSDLQIFAALIIITGILALAAVLCALEVWLFVHTYAAWTSEESAAGWPFWIWGTILVWYTTILVKPFSDFNPKKRSSS